MPLLRTRPSVRLRLPREVVPGSSFDIAILLDAREPVDIEWCDVTISGHETVRETYRAPVIAPLAARACGPRLLPVGTTTLPVRVSIPSGAPRTKSGRGSRVDYTIAVHASVPWWPDARGQFALHVAGNPPTDLVGAPHIAVSRIEGPIPGQPYAELSVSTDLVEVGGIIDARVSMREVGAARVTLSLIAYDKLHDGQSIPTGQWTIPAKAEDVLAFRVPSDLTPSMRAPSFELEHWLVAEAHGTFSPLVKAAMPIRIVDRGAARATARIVAPHVGDARLEELFRDVAAQEGAQLEQGPTLVARRGEVEARARRELGREGTRLVVDVSYPSLRLDLHVHARALLAIDPSGRRLARASGLDAGSIVRARDEEQSATFLQRLAPKLERARAIRMDDDALHYEVATSANDRASVARVVRDMIALADALTQPPPLPTALVDATDAWRHLAVELSGTLEPGHACVVATNDEAEIAIRTTFRERGGPNGTLVTVRPIRELRLDAPIALDEDQLPAEAAVSPEVRAAIERLRKHGRVLVGLREILVTMDLPLGNGVPVIRAKEAVDGALRLMAALRPSSGPFR